MNKIITTTISIIIFTLMLSGCAIYKAEVQQGNALSNSTVSQLEKGMSKAEVASILGNPLLQDNFRSDRWDYVFFKGKNKQVKNRQNLTLFFKNDQLVQVKK